MSQQALVCAFREGRVAYFLSLASYNKAMETDSVTFSDQCYVTDCLAVLSVVQNWCKNILQ